MTLDYSRLQSVTARQLVSALQRDGSYSPARKEAIAITVIRTDGA